MKLSVCIPMYNESAIARSAAETFSSACERIAAGDWEVVFCDDGSTDGCGDIVRGCGIDGVRVVGYEHNRGKGHAVKTAVLSSTGDIVIVTDCDNAYGTEKLAEAVEVLDRESADAAIGSRLLDPDGYAGYTFFRKLTSRIYIIVLRLLAGFRHSDSQCGFKAWRGEAGRRVFALCETDGWAYDIEAILIAEKLGFRVAEMPVRVINHRESKVRPFRDAIRMTADVCRIKKRIRRLDAAKIES